MTNAQQQFNAGAAWAQGGDRIRAIECFREGLLDEPDNARAWYMLGTLYMELGDPFTGLMGLNKAAEFEPRLIDVHINRACCYTSMGRMREAEAAADTALALNALHPFAIGNKAYICMLTGRRKEAADWYFQEIQVCPPEGRDAIRILYGLALLGQGKLKDGWAECSPRWSNPAVNPFRRKKLKPWDGKSKENLLLVTDQGYGDIIQFMRYAPMLKERIGGNKVYVEVMRPVARLCARMPGVDQVFVLGDDEIPEDVETFASIAMLPMWFGTDIVADIPWPGPYVAARGLRQAIWNEQLKVHIPAGHHKVGIVWATGDRIEASSKESARRKSVTLNDYAPLARVPDVTFVSLQVGDHAAQAMNPPSGLRLVDLHHDITDFYDTAALIENLDLVISTCTAVIHLAGAMGKPAWLLLHNCGDWRWLSDRVDSPWYPSLRIFQQPKWGDWKSVMVCVAENLHRRIERSTAPTAA